MRTFWIAVLAMGVWALAASQLIEPAGAALGKGDYFALSKWLETCRVVGTVSGTTINAGIDCDYMRGVW